MARARTPSSRRPWAAVDLKSPCAARVGIRGATSASRIPIVALARAIHLFSQTRVSSSPKTTFNIGVIHGGTSVNSIPESASMRVDIRSTSAFEIERLELELRSAIEHAVEEEEIRGSRNHNSPSRGGLEAEIVAIGNRPRRRVARRARESCKLHMPLTRTWAKRPASSAPLPTPTFPFLLGARQLPLARAARVAGRTLCRNGSILRGGNSACSASC